jgi:hypothetical protein
MKAEYIFITSIVMLIVGAMVLSILWRKLAGHGRLKPPLPWTLLVILVGGLLYPIYQTVAVASVLGIYGIFIVFAGLIERRRRSNINQLVEQEKPKGPLNSTQAMALVRSILGNNDEIAILEGETIVKPWGFIFFYQSVRFLESGRVSDMLAANAPYFVNRYTGEVIPTGSAKPVEEYIKEYEQRLKTA